MTKYPLQVSGASWGSFLKRSRVLEEIVVSGDVGLEGVGSFRGSLDFVSLWTFCDNKKLMNNFPPLWSGINLISWLI
jgi:hypothetical protein